MKNNILITNKEIESQLEPMPTDDTPVKYGMGVKLGCENDNKFEDGGNVGDEDVEFEEPENNYIDLFGKEYKLGGKLGNGIICWDDIPTEIFEKIKKVNPIKNIAYTKDNIKLYSLLKPFASKDELRPQMQSIYFDENGITCTDSHKLIHIPNENNESDYGIYVISDLIDYKQGDKIDFKYPQYKNVVPEDNPYNKVIDVEKAYRFFAILKECNVSNQSTNLFVWELPEFKIGVKISFIVDIFKFFLQINVKKVLFSYSSPTRPTIFNTNLNMKNGINPVGNSTFALLMPMMVENEQNAGSIDVVVNCFHFVSLKY